MYIRNKYHITFTPLYLRYRCAEEQTRRESFLAVNKLCKLATESYVICSLGHIFFAVFSMTKSCMCVWFFFNFFCFRNFFRIFKTKILYYIFMTIFIFYEALKKSRVFLFHLIKLLINFDKEIRQQLHFLLIQVHLFKNTRNIFCLKLTKVKIFITFLRGISVLCERIFGKLFYFFLIQLKSVGNKTIFRQDFQTNPRQCFLGRFLC